MRFENQTAIVTGASRGIGKAIADRLRSEGATVFSVSRSENGLDVADHDSVQDFCAKILEQSGGKIDILVNNAGITRDGLAMRMPIKDWDTVLDTNLRGAFSFSQAIMRAMIKRRSGRIINITSVIGIIGNAGQANYAASKAGLIGLTKSLARELASRNITVNAIAPGFIETNMTAGLTPEIKLAILRQIPMGHTGAVADIASAVTFLASAEASYITGQVLCVDGGMAM